MCADGRRASASAASITVAGADGDDEDRHVVVVAQHARAAARAVHGAVDAQQRRRAGDAVLVQRRDDRAVLAASGVDGELGLVAQVVRQRELVARRSRVTRPPNRSASTSRSAAWMGSGSSTAIETTGKSSESDSSRSVRSRCPAPKPAMPRSTTLSRSPCRAKIAGERVGEEAAVGAVALPEVDA